VPETYIVSNFSDGRTQWLATFDEDIDTESATDNGVRISGANLLNWFEAHPALKMGKMASRAAFLEWDFEQAQGVPSFEFSFADTPTSISPEMSFVFSAAQSEDNGLLDWSIRVIDADGVFAKLSVSFDQVLTPPVRGRTRRLSVFSEIGEHEPVMERFKIPLTEFHDKAPNLDLSSIQSVRFDFDRSPKGAIYLDDVGFAPTGFR